MPTKIQLGGKRGAGLSALVDDEDIDLVARHKWYLHPKGYAIAGINDFEVTGRHLQQTTSMHRLIMGCKTGDGQTVDHINHDPLDNRRQNLRIVTPGESLRNRRKFRNSGQTYKGVHCRNDRFVAFIHIGGFDVEEDAARAYDDAIRVLFPGHPVNFPREGEVSALADDYVTQTTGE